MGTGLEWGHGLECGHVPYCNEVASGVGMQWRQRGGLYPDLVPPV